MSDPTNVIEALSRVMDELPAIGKGGKADPKQGGYAYRGIEQITREAQRLFAKYGVVFVPRVLGHKIVDIEVNGKPWTDTILAVEYDVYGPGNTEPSKITVGPLIAIGRDNSDKGANKCMTQAFKYALLQVLCISDAKDDGDQASHEADATTPPAPTKEAEEAMKGLVDIINLTPEEERQELKDYLSATFGPSRQMDIDTIHRAATVAAGWPASRVDPTQNEML